jgi:hypothetical protein
VNRRRFSAASRRSRLCLNTLNTRVEAALRENPDAAVEHRNGNFQALICHSATARRARPSLLTAHRTAS